MQVPWLGSGSIFDRNLPICPRTVLQQRSKLNLNCTDDVIEIFDYLQPNLSGYSEVADDDDVHAYFAVEVCFHKIQKPRQI